jgi:hypothetical protein
MASLFVFSTGSVIITAVKSGDELRSAFEWLTAFVDEHGSGFAREKDPAARRRPRGAGNKRSRGVAKGVVDKKAAAGAKKRRKNDVLSFDFSQYL